MATSSTTKNIFREADITGLDIKDLNKKLKEERVSKREQQDIKKQRRRIKMKIYRKESRQRKARECECLELERGRLSAELARLQQEVVQLQSIRCSIVQNMMDEVEGSDEEFIIVD